MYMSNKSLNRQVPSETESMITKWSVWINSAQFGSYLLCILGWILCITSTATDRWRIWHVKKKGELYFGLMKIGIWRACYTYNVQYENSYEECEQFTPSMQTLPKEIFLAQDMLSLGCIMGAVGVTFMSFALWNIVKAITQKTFLLTLFNLGILMNFLTGIFIIIPISWNTYSIMINADIKFPDDFKLLVPPSPEKQEIGAGIYIGYVAAILLLVSGVMIFCYGYVFRNSQENRVLSPAVGPLAPVDIFRNTGSSGSSLTIDEQKEEEPEAWTDAVTTANYADIKESKQSMHQQLLEDAKMVPIVLVAPYVVKSQVEGEEAVQRLDSRESHSRRKNHQPD
ncbi:claudin-34-like [Erythrolamprus reginae]|uniref:claudin-34-like n=1 Tax=Erythrolamprus reginae TaxID=121349 RepID=UPI00396C4C27